LSGKNEQDESATEKAKRGRKAGAIPFPRNSLIEALRVPQIIWDTNAGEPLALLDLAKALERSPTSMGFAELLRSSQRYGLTNESYTQDLTKTISLTPLGNSIVAPTPDEDVNSLKRNALETPDLFRDVFSILHGKVIPPAEPFKNMLIRTFHLDKDDADACYAVLTQNIEELGLAETIQGKTYLRLDKLGIAIKPAPEQAATEPEGVPAEPETKKVAVAEEKPVACPPSKVPWVFISHSKNKKILEQIKQVLSFGSFSYEISEERETPAIPLSDKVFGLMRKCNCAIINISADEEKKQGETYAINENVLIEVGGAFLHYDKRVILIIDKKLKDVLPSMMQGLTAIFYDGDELSWNDGMRLQSALTAFRGSL
jgi:predicted nucleotide-binding protein